MAQNDSTGHQIPTVTVPSDPPHDTEQPAIALGEAAVSGSLWTVMQVVVAKLAALGGMLVLTRLLTPDEYGVATLAISISAMLMVLHPSAMGDVLMARLRELPRIAGTAQRLSFVTSMAFALIIAASGPLMARHYRSPVLAYACAWVALRPLSDWAIMLPLTRLRAGLQFRIISTVDAASQSAATLASVLMAWARCGFLSLILPLIGSNAVRAWFYRRPSTASVSPARDTGEVRPLLHRFALSGLGQYVHGCLFPITPLIIGSFTSQEEVGWYAMAFMMSSQINSVAGFGMGLVLQPILVQMSGDVARQSAAFLRAIRVLATVAMPVCLLQAVLVPAVVRLFLPAKWAGAIVPAQILSLGQAFFFSVNPAIGLLTAQGRFGTFMMWQITQFVVVVGGMLAAGLIWHQAPLIPIVLVGGLYHVISAPTGVWIGLRGRGIPLRACLGVFVRPLSLAAVSILPVFWMLSRILQGSRTADALSLPLLPVISLAIFVLLVRRFDQAAARDCRRLADGVLRRVQRHRTVPT